METIAKSGKEVLKAILWLYENRLGHTKGHYFDFKPVVSGESDGVSAWNLPAENQLTPEFERLDRACLSGCIALVRSSPHHRQMARRLIEDEINGGVSSYGRILSWNDKEERTKEDVINLLKKVINE